MQGNRPDRLTCSRTGTVTSACMASPDGGCPHCGRPASEVDRRLRADALADEAEQMTMEAFR